MEHGPLQCVASVPDLQAQGFLVVGPADHLFKIKVLCLQSGKKNSLPDALQVEGVDPGGAFFPFRNGQEAEPVIFRRVFQLQRQIVVTDAVSLPGLIGEIHILSPGEGGENRPKMRLIVRSVEGIAVRIAVVVMKILLLPE